MRSLDVEPTGGRPVDTVAGRNQKLIDQANPATDEMLLLSLENNIALLEVKGSHGVSILQSLVLEHLFHDVQYRAEGTLGDRHADTLQARTLARLATYAEGYDIPVLVTRTERNEFTEPVVTVVDHHLEYKQTRMGLRILGEDFETLVYPVDDGAYYQTTFAYWRQLLEARAAQVGAEPTTTPSTSTPNRVGKGVTVDGESVTVGTDPLLDAWTASAGGR